MASVAIHNHGKMDKMLVATGYLEHSNVNYLLLQPKGGDDSTEVSLYFGKHSTKMVRDALRNALSSLDLIIAEQTHDELLAATGHEGALARPGDS